MFDRLGRVTAVAAASLIVAAPGSHSLADEVAEYGAYLSAECVTCHGSASAGSKVPHLAGRSLQDIMKALAAFKSGERPSPVMQDIAARLADDEMLALATYFSSLATTTTCSDASSAQEKNC